MDGFSGKNNRLEFDPNAVFDSQEGHQIPSLSTVDDFKSESSQPIFSAGTIDETMFSAEERAEIDQIANGIDVENVNQIVTFGSSAQKNISDFSTSILQKVRTIDLGDVGQSLRELTIALDASIEPEKKGLMGVFQKAKRGANSVKANYAKAESNVDRIESNLKKHQAILTQDIATYQKMHELNLSYYKELTMYIIAGKKALDHARNGKLLQLKTKATESSQQEDVQAYRDFSDLCTRFEKKLSDMELTRVISLQTAPQIRMIQNNAREMLDKLQSSLANTIPLWRNQLVLSIGIEHGKRTIDAQNELADRTNRLLSMNAEKLKMATVEAARASERPIVELETLQKCNDRLISSIAEVITIHEEGMLRRRQAQDALVKSEQDLKAALLSTT